MYRAYILYTRYTSISCFLTSISQNNLLKSVAIT